PPAGVRRLLSRAGRSTLSSPSPGERSGVVRRSGMPLDEEFATTEPPASRPAQMRLAPALILAAGIVGSTVLLVSLRGAERAAALARFELRAKDRIALLRRALEGDVEQIHSTVALFDSSQTVEPEEFATFTAGSM